MMTVATWPSNFLGLLNEFAPAGSSGKMSLGSYPPPPTTLPIHVHRKTTWMLEPEDFETGKREWSRMSTKQTKRMRSPASWPAFRSFGMGGPTEFVTLSIAEFNRTLLPCLSDDVVCSLSDILETGDHLSRFYLSPKACAGILRRAAKRGKTLPALLEQALRAVAGSGDRTTTPPSPTTS